METEKKPRTFLAALLGGFLAGCVTWALSIGAIILAVVTIGSLATSEGKYSESVIKDGPGGARIAVVNLRGVIVSETDYRAGLGDSSAERVIGQIGQADADSSVKAIVLRVDSPGGGVVPSAQIAEAVKGATKKIYVVMEDLAASGGYYVAAPSDYIFADQNTLTGSIGVIMELPDLTGLLDKVGVGFNTIKSGELKDIGSSFKNMSVEERSVLQGIVDQAFADFKAVVKEGRNILDADLVGIDDGRVLTGEQARDKKLVDEIGDFDDAAKKALADVGITEAEIFEYAAPGFFESLASSKQSISKLFSRTNTSAPRLWYLWRP